MATTTLSNAEWQVTVGATAADLGIDALGGTLTAVTGGEGTDSWVLREAFDGQVVLANTGGSTTTSAALAIGNNAWIDGKLDATGKAVRIRHKFSYEKRNADGVTDAVNSQPSLGIAGYARGTVTYGLNPLNSTGHWLVVSPLSLTTSVNRAIEWDTVHFLDIWIEKTEAAYNIAWFIDGVYFGHADAVAQATARNCWKLNWAVGLLHWFNWYGCRIDDFASGGIAGNIGSPLEEVDDESGYALPEWDDTSVVALHGAAGQGSGIDLNSDTPTGPEIYDTVWGWRAAMDATPTGVSKGTLAFDEFLPAYDAAIAVAPGYKATGPNITVDSCEFYRPRQSSRQVVRVPLGAVNENGFEMQFYDADSNPEWGFRIPQGTGDTTLRLRRWNGSAWVSVNTGLIIRRDDPVQIIDFSLCSGEGIGVTIERCSELGAAADHLQWYKDDGTVFTGLLAATGSARLILTNNLASTDITWYMPTIGVQPCHWESSYSQGTVNEDPSIATPSSATVSFQSRRAYSATAGRVGGMGYGPYSRPAGPFHVRGRAGASVGNMLDDSMKGDVAGYLQASRAVPFHLIDGKINAIQEDVSDDADWLLYGERNIADLEAWTMELVTALRVQGVEFIIATTPSPDSGDWVAGATTAHRAFNDTLREWENEARFEGGYFADMIEHFGSEAAATAAVSFTGVHPDDDVAYMDAYYASAALARVRSDQSDVDNDGLPDDYAGAQGRRFTGRRNYISPYNSRRLFRGRRWHNRPDSGPYRRDQH